MYSYDVTIADGKGTRVPRDLHARFPGIRKGEFRSVYACARFKRGGNIERRDFHGEIVMFGGVNCKVKYATAPGSPYTRTVTLQSHQIIDIL